MLKYFWSNMLFIDLTKSICSIILFYLYLFLFSFLLFFKHVFNLLSLSLQFYQNKTICYLRFAPSVLFEIRWEANVKQHKRSFYIYSKDKSKLEFSLIWEKIIISWFRTSFESQQLFKLNNNRATEIHWADNTLIVNCNKRHEQHKYLDLHQLLCFIKYFFLDSLIFSEFLL